MMYRTRSAHVHTVIHDPRAGSSRVAIGEDLSFRGRGWGQWRSNVLCRLCNAQGPGGKGAALRGLQSEYSGISLLLCDTECSQINHRRTGHFLEGGWIDFARKIWSSARKMNSRTNKIKQDETRKLDYIDCGKSLKNLYLHLHCPFIVNIR